YRGKGFQEPWFLIVPPDSEAWLPTEEVVRLYRQRMQIEQCFRDWKSHLGLRGLHLQVQKSERLLRVLMGFTLAYLIVLLLGTDPLAEKLRPYFEQQRRKPRLQGPQRTIHRFAGALRFALGATSAKTHDRDSRATGAGAWSGAAAGLLVLTSRARFSSRNPRSSSPVSVREIVCRAPSSECRVALAERNHSVCLVSENASTLRQFLCGREFIARE